MFSHKSPIAYKFTHLCNSLVAATRIQTRFRIVLARNYVNFLIRERAGECLVDKNEILIERKRLAVLRRERLFSIRVDHTSNVTLVLILQCSYKNTDNSQRLHCSKLLQ